ncbi:EIICBA-Mtl [Kluyvera cryocrescens]|uniref:EIICBA-Mtl n=1 Tax=Kluyvera cryocrescens TaxID=580 RepID=A0A485CNB4_KLUCR|nr:EIICBA-Mtl [Kluyvera cryocrescens]
MFVGKGSAKQSAGGAAIIHFFGGIHEIYFPYVLMNPRLILAVILGGMTGVFTLTLFNAGLVSPASPGSIFAVLLDDAKSVADWRGAVDHCLHAGVIPHRFHAAQTRSRWR